MRYESSSSGESVDTVAAQYRIAADRGKVAILEAGLKAAAAEQGVQGERREVETGDT